MKINITFEEIIELHNSIIKNYGGDLGILNPSSLKFALNRIKYYANTDNFFHHLALLLRSITSDHPFVDGNKRTGLAVTIGILRDNNLYFSFSKEKYKEFILNVAKGKFNDIDKLSKYIKNNIKEL